MIAVVDCRGERRGDGLGCVQVDVEVIVEVVAIESPEQHKATANESSRVSPSSPWRSLCTNEDHLPCARIDGEQVLQVFTSPASEDIDHSIEVVGGLSPPPQPITAQLHLPPHQILSVAALLEPPQVQLVQIAQAIILALAPSEHVDVISADAGGVEPAWTWPDCALHFDFPPGEGLQVVKPEVSQIINALPSEHKQVGVAELCTVVGAFPGGGLVLEGLQLHPVHLLQVQHADAVEALLARPSAPEQDQLSIHIVVVECGIGSWRRQITGCSNFLPHSLLQAVPPKVAQIV